MLTIRDIATLAGVSRSTVSRVLNNSTSVNEETRLLVKKVMEEQGYRPNVHAQSLSNKEAKTIGVVIPEMLDPFFATMSAGIEKVCQQSKTHILLAVGGKTAETELAAIHNLVRQQCDAVVVHAKVASDEQLVSIAERLPGFVLLNRHIKKIASHCVWLNNKEGGRLAAEYLLKQNKKAIAVVASNFGIADPQQRIAGVKQAHIEAGVPHNESAIAIAHPNREGGALAAQKLLLTGQCFDAVVCYNDLMAIGVIQTLQENGIKVPEQVSVMGFDDLPIAAYCTPRLTTIRYPIEQMAAQAARLALFKVRGIKAQEGFNKTGASDGVQVGESRQDYQPVLVVRESG